MKNARTVLGLVGLAVLLPPFVADACGPDFGPEPRFFVVDNPDRPFGPFAAGRLGILRRTFDPPYLAFAFRSMMGIPTTPEEQKHLVAGWTDAESRYGPDASWARDQWAAVRQEVAPFKDLPPVDVNQMVYASNDAYIHGDAFLHAAATARALAKEWKQRPALLKEWLGNQDAVFSKGCTLADPAPGIEESLTPKEKARRQAERDYQAAAMHLYCGKFDEAAEAFQRIASSADSPYRVLGAYLVARTRVREALFGIPPYEEGPREVDPAVLGRFRRAEEAIQKVLADPKLREVHGPARRLLSLVRLRLSRDTWRCELFSRVLEKGTGSGLESELASISLGAGAEGNACPGLKPRAAELSEWLGLMAAPAPEEPGDPEAPWPAKAYATAVARWKKSAHQPWLVLALLSARADSPDVPTLLADAEKVPVDAPAGMTLAWRSVQLLRERGQLAEARARLDAIPPEQVRDLASADNALREERLHLANSWDEALRNAAQFLVEELVLAPLNANDPAPSPEPMGLSASRALFLESHVPTRRLREWAALPTLTPELRRQLSWAVFARAAVVGDDAMLKAQAATLAETEPKARAELLAIVGRPTAEERLFDARLLVMGLPVVSARVQPARDRLANVSPTLDLTEDRSWTRNGWCVPGTKNLEDPLKTPLPFASPEERADAAAEWRALNEAGSSVAFFSRVALDWAKAHPRDPRSPIALFRAVRSSKRGCGQNTPEAKKAFAYLHKQYGKTEWARNTPYVY
ncbi:MULTISPECIES: hypothetical protein [unclassified Corallococcus]|uniref:hypothetical protein n=1 Tax=unclassified Corallococcus TaxID=2685029 RepID=UPI001A8D7D11|nr:MULTISPECIES: hypothetical protein [unclassified Corallococcus]MBN9687790.1 hypothetical protein [Corallococcus sp. NCSPR001]WAS88397.1 hypothetical protein O0N60_15755 [Corallococcus sp. NCRR]